jgi:hypothetical protein
MASGEGSSHDSRKMPRLNALASGNRVPGQLTLQGEICIRMLSVVLYSMFAQHRRAGGKLGKHLPRES